MDKSPSVSLASIGNCGASQRAVERPVQNSIVQDTIERDSSMHNPLFVGWSIDVATEIPIC